ncbi:D-lactaldehyde dehydrogenase [Lactarius indigo]|nr:D-lactaldehyde dehydrogenase [Lactarius indigo]
MVAVSPPAKVLVTGANGYLAVWIVKKYLEAGYSVRGTVRSLSKSAFLKEQFAEYGKRLELVVIEDITKGGAFDEAVKGVDAIAHTASPFHHNAIDPDELIVPAVGGTASVLNSALKHGTSVRRVVLTSSVAAVREDHPTRREYDETSWNNAVVAKVVSKGSAAGPATIYLASKTLAERAAWEFVAAHKAELAWDLVVINPPLIFGPSLSPAKTIDEINTSQREIYDTLTGAWTGAQLRGQGNWVHVSIAADAHVRATHAAAAGGERIIVRSGYFFYQDILDAAVELGIPNVPRGEPYSTGNIPKTKLLVTTKAEDLLGLKVTVPLKDVIEESVKDFKARGYPGFTA